jgi:hypothetical protein
MQIQVGSLVNAAYQLHIENNTEKIVRRIQILN